MLHTYCQREVTIKKIMIDKEMIMSSVETFRNERMRIGGPVIERKIIPAPVIAPAPEQKQEDKAPA